MKPPATRQFQMQRTDELQDRARFVRRSSFRLWAILVLSIVPTQAIQILAGENDSRPLRHKIDEQITNAIHAKGLTPAARCSDGEFVRRVYLDLVGTIPTAVEAVRFIDDPDPTKREKLIDRLLASPEHARHMARVFDVVLMERRPDKHVQAANWRDFLRVSFASNKPWDQLAREILAADGVDEKLRPAAKFLLDRDGEPHILTRDISRMFLGMNLQCAQCHDHPLIGDYEQDYYYGLFAFLNRSYVFTDKKKQVSLAEKADGDVTYKSVFDRQGTQKNTGPKLLDGPPVEEPLFEKGKEYEVAPADGVRPVPKFSRRSQLAPRIANAERVEFKQNIANRLWAMMMGRGLVDPVDFNHSDNPPSHPELLATLGADLAARQFDLKFLLAELANSETYQRASELPSSGDGPPPSEFFAAFRLKPLSPEQLAWSLMQATGLADAERKALGDKLNEQSLHDRLVGNVGTIVTRFAGVAGQPEQGFQATMDQALFLTNGNLVRSWLDPRTGNLMDRLVQTKELDALADELYLSVLTRRPTVEERSEVIGFLKDCGAGRTAALQQLAWALIASAEVRFNH